MAIAETPFVGKVREAVARPAGAPGRRAFASNESEQMQHLLEEVDHALERMNIGKFGLCEVCHDTIEAGRLLNDPPISVCLGCLSPAQQRSLEYDLELAAQIQRGLLPPPNVAIPGWQVAYHYRPAGVVGGDYCDVIGSGDGGLYFLIADVAGKGIAAALLSTNLRAVFRALIPLGLEHGENAGAGQPPVLREHAAHAVRHTGVRTGERERRAGNRECRPLAGATGGRVAEPGSSRALTSVWNVLRPAVHGVQGATGTGRHAGALHRRRFRGTKSRGRGVWNSSYAGRCSRGNCDLPGIAGPSLPRARRRIPQPGTSAPTTRRCWRFSICR